MIVKKVSKKTSSQSSFRDLSNYMLDVKNEQEKVEGYDFTNCSYGEFEENLVEIESTQSINTRTTADKTYHLIVSFQDDENPTPETMKIIEEELVRSIGLEDHQRFSVVHGNTNNKHIHIAINKVNPNDFNYVSPYQDIPKLHNRAEELEKSLGLKKDNHTPSRERKREKSPQEIHAGVENFKNWVKDQTAAPLKEILSKEGGSWEDLHKTLGEYDLELIERGNGMVISSRTGNWHIKASDVSRDLSKGKLEGKFGKFEKPGSPIVAKEKFGARAKDKNPYWEEYQRQIKAAKIEKPQLLEAQKIQIAKEKVAILAANIYERGEVKRHKYLTRDEKKAKYKEIAFKKREDLKTLYTKSREQRGEVFTKVKHISYKEFLINKALEGDKKALKLLQNTTKKEAERYNNTNIVLGSKQSKTVIDLLSKPKITKAGDVVYSLGDSKLLDKGSLLKVGELKQDSHYLQTLTLAREKFGKVLDIEGSEEFKKQMVQVAIKFNVDVVFTDKTMESVRHAGRDRTIPYSKTNDRHKRATRKTNLVQNAKEFKKLQDQIKERYNNGRERASAGNGTYDKGRWDNYLASARDNIRGLTSQLTNVISDFRDLGRTGAETIRERIGDVQYSKDRGIRKERKIESPRNTRTETDRGRNEALRRNDAKSKQPFEDTRGKGIER